MNDLLNDISSSSGNNNNNKGIKEKSGNSSDGNSLHLNQLFSSLEHELDINNNKELQQTTTSSSSSLMSPLPPGLNQPSAGAMIVDHHQHQPYNTTTTTNTTTNNTNTTSSTNEDAWSLALSQFSALSLADDFVKADKERKVQQQKQKDQSYQIVESVLFDGDDYDDNNNYNDKNDVMEGNDDNTKKAMVGLFPGLLSSSTTTASTAAAAPATPSKGMGDMTKTPPNTIMSSPMPHSMLQQQQQQQHNMMPPHPNHGPPFASPPPPHIIPGQGPLPPHMMHGGSPMPPHMMQGGSPMPPHMMQGRPMPPLPPHMMMNPGVMPHPALLHQMQMMQQQQQQQHQRQQHLQAHQQQMTPQKGSETKVSTSSTTKQPEKQIFTKIDFPALGANEDDIEKERKEEVAKLKQAKKEEKERLKKEKEEAKEEEERVQKAKLNIRITFQDPSPTAPPVAATSIPSTSMSSRDLCHVLHSIMRPLLTFENVLDAYNADYYHWSYNDRKSRNLLFHNNMGGNVSLPNPVWKETKMKAQTMENKFRNAVETRANEWSKEKQALGKVAKTNVKRPRALLATTTLSSKGVTGLDTDEEMDESKQRAQLWASRAGIDKGYSAYLNLVELRRLLQSRPGDALSNVDEVENRREELLQDVEENVNKLHSAFGVLKKDSDEIDIDANVLSRTLSLPKGRMLLSRVIDEGILPHPSACHLLSFAIRAIFEAASTSDLTAAPPAGEDRLLRSLTGLVRTVQPSVDIDNLLACLTSVIESKALMKEKNRDMKSVLAGKRTLMELLHAIFTRGGEVCVGEHESDWKAKESSFLLILTGSE